MVRRVQTEPKTSLDCAAFEAFSARFMASIAALSAQIEPSRPLGRWELAFMVETRSNYERTVGCEGCDETSVSFVMTR